jgi:hypothetical protein
MNLVASPPPHSSRAPPHATRATAGHPPPRRRPSSRRRPSHPLVRCRRRRAKCACRRSSRPSHRQGWHGTFHHGTVFRSQHNLMTAPVCSIVTNLTPPGSDNGNPTCRTPSRTSPACTSTSATSWSGTSSSRAPPTRRTPGAGTSLRLNSPPTTPSSLRPSSCAPPQGRVGSLARTPGWQIGDYVCLTCQACIAG